MKTPVVFSSRTAPVDVVQNGKVIGHIYATPTKTRNYVLNLKGIYWMYGDILSSKAGASEKRFKTLKLAKEYVMDNSSEIAKIISTINNG